MPSPKSFRPLHHRVRHRLAGASGAIDLASIMVGVLVIGIIGGVISATVFAVIPWSQDSAAKQDLASVRTAETVWHVAHGGWATDEQLRMPSVIDAGGASGGGHFSAAISAPVAGQPLLQQSSRPLEVNAGPAGWVAATRSATGTIFFATNISKAVTVDAPTKLPADVDAPTLPVPGAPEITAQEALKELVEAQTKYFWAHPIGSAGLWGNGDFYLPGTESHIYDSARADPSTAAFEAALGYTPPAGFRMLSGLSGEAVMSAVQAPDGQIWVLMPSFVHAPGDPASFAAGPVLAGDAAGLDAAMGAGFSSWPPEWLTRFGITLP